MNEDRQPIGYWLKRLDGLIDRSLERTLNADGLTRRHWQVLNTLVTRPATVADLVIALKPFVGDDATPVERVLDDLLARGWLRRAPDQRLELSEHGESAHAAVATRVAATRQLLRRGITDAEYMNVVTTLQRMAANLDGS